MFKFFAVCLVIAVKFITAGVAAAFMAYKLVVLVRQDLKLPKGKLAVQVAHASVECVLKTDRKLVDAWRREGGKKVVLKVADEKELLRFRGFA